MCGIAGLFLKDTSLEPSLGRLLGGMMIELGDRGPDSSGFAVYGAPTPGQSKLTIRLPDGGGQHAARAIADGATAATGHPVEVRVRGTHAVLSYPDDARDALRAFLAARHPEAHLVSSGERMEIFKDIGRPEVVAEAYDLSTMHGSHAIGHTRMATESAVTIDGAHPFSTGDDQCLVHNGSLSNHNAVRRTLRREGLSFETENDSEVAAGYLTWRMREGASLSEALEQSLADLDGFYTFVVGTRTGFAVLRDPIACKPAVMAETDQWVAFGSEYRALTGLPGIENARVFEPEPATVYAWERT
ncbi:glutamine amidotransferase family protein [Pseudoxanthobacter sp. M-2]|uniref:class II glutamine amidotransferase n=1 Tax=Pseudoxanthobacter sp. M-2 TaxID=3078754 RepID=UPI0038FC713A